MSQEAKTKRSVKLLERLRQRGAVGLEGAATETADLTDARIRTSLEAARERFRKIAERARAGGNALIPEHEREQARVLADAEAALKRLASDGEDAEVSDQQLVGLEAIIIPDGTRPSLFVQDDDVSPKAPEAGTWKGLISDHRIGIAEVAQAVGRINSDIGFPNYAGTGFVVAPGLIATNRHVLELLVGGPEPRADGSWQFLKPVTIDFAAEFERAHKKAFRVTGVRYAGPEAINKTLSPTKLDLALLTVKTSNGTDSLPPPVPLSRRVRALQEKSDVYVMGFPARPQGESGEVLMRVFQDEYFVKRFAPGYVDDGPDAVEDGGHHRVFTHDASTLGGNSGSCVIEFRIQGRAAVGLHFGGLSREKNYAHAIARIEDVLELHGVKFMDD